MKALATFAGLSVCHMLWMLLVWFWVALFGGGYATLYGFGVIGGTFLGAAAALVYVTWTEAID